MCPVKRVAEAPSVVEEFLDEVVSGFYDTVRATPELVAFFEDDAMMAHARAAQQIRDRHLSQTGLKIWISVEVEKTK